MRHALCPRGGKVSKIYDALEQARKVRITEDFPKKPPPPLPVDLSPRASAADTDMEQEMITLYQTITAALPDIDHRSVLFVGSRSNEGTSTIARQLAKAVSLRMEKSVLLIDLDRSRPDLHVYANLKPEVDAEDSLDNDVPFEKSLCRVEESSLYVMPLFQKTIVTPRNIDAAKGNAFWEPLKERFDLIIVDSPPATMFPDGPAIVSQVDGVILVVEAEKTRWQVAQNVKEKILQHGGNIIGVAFNKRRYYIPNFIYRLL
jgi:protein-tyrosine kinase